MSDVQVWEMLDSMSGSVSNESEQGEVRELKRRYLIGQTEGFNDTVSQMENYAPQYVNSDGAGLYWVRKRLEVQGVGNRYFDCTATYQTLQPKKKENNNNDDGNPVPGSVSWDASGKTEHRTQALEEKRFGLNAPDFHGAINVSGNSVQGIDIVVPSMRYSESWILPIELAMHCDYIGAVFSLTGTVNANQFRCFEPGTCLFMGARGQWQGDQPYVTVTFEFEARPKTTIEMPSPGVGGSLELAGVKIEKTGWQYLWFLYGADTNNNTLVQKPVAAYLDTVYKDEDWEGLVIAGRAIAQQLAGQLGIPAVGPNGAPGQ